jgi:hypothetical protein
MTPMSDRPMAPSPAAELSDTTRARALAALINKAESQLERVVS